MKKLIFCLLALPYSLFCQVNEDYIEFDSTNLNANRATYFSYEKSYMSDECWIMFQAPDGSRVSFSNRGYLTYWDSIGDSRSQDIDCGVYPTVKAVFDSIILREFNYYWFSETHCTMISEIQARDNDPNATYFATIDGESFTCEADPEYILKTYRKIFPDVVLVAKLPRGKGKIDLW